MSSPAPLHVDPIRLTVTRLHHEARNPLISSVLEPNLIPFYSDPNVCAVLMDPR
jgi:hypothetical protein